MDYQNNFFPPKLIVLFLFTTLTSQTLSIDPRYMSCAPRTCGQGPNISYPFWFSDDQHSFCGHPNFEITCRRNNPILTISNDDYVIKNISYGNHSLLVAAAAAAAVYQETCPTPAHNFSLDRSPFNISPGYTNFSLLYNCSQKPDEIYSTYPISCASNDAQYSFAAFHIEALEYYNYSLGSCQSIVKFPLHAGDGDFESLLSMNYTEVLRLGFVLNWTANNCSTCERSGGRCGFENNEFICFCRDRPRLKSCPNGEKPNVRRKVAIAVAAGLLGIGAVMITCGLIYCIKNPPSNASILASPRRKNTSNNQDIEAFMRKHGPLTLHNYSYSDVKRMTNSFRDKLGQGGYGSVYKGKQVDGRLVAVKVLNVSNGYDGEELINEVASISRTSHVNVVTLLGLCLEGNQRALIYDFMPNGSLEKFLNNEHNLKVSEHLGWEKLHDIAIGVARGLEYLHCGCNTRIVHFDIKPHNILLDQELCPKISDFGLSKLCTRKDSFMSMSMARGTIGYIAPEVFSRQFGGVSHKSDVYSYGMLVLEMVGARTKGEVQTENSSEKYFPQWIYKHLEVNLEFELQQGEISAEDIEIVRKMNIVGLWCIQMNPAGRPSISKVIEMLEGPAEALTIPPKPFLSSPIARSPPSYSSSTTSST